MRPLLFALATPILAGLAASSARAQSAPAKPGVHVSIDAGRAVLAAGQPCPVRVTFANDGGAPVKLDWSITMGEGLHLRGVDLAPGAQEKTLPPVTHVDASSKPFQLPPSVAVTVTIDVATIDNGAYATLCGVYDTADLWFEADGVSSPPARIDLVEDLSKTVVVLETNKGVLKIGLDPAHAPLACRNFVRHAQKGTYDGTLFHRVIAGFMAQGGDPNSKDSAKPESWGGGGAPFNGKRFHAEMDPAVKFERGTVAMARNGDPMSRYGQAPLQALLQMAQQGDQVAQLAQGRLGMLLNLEGVNLADMQAVDARYQQLQKQGFFREAQPFLDSQGSQFFLCFARVEHLDGNYIGFGKLLAGDDVLSKLEASVDPATANTTGRPKEELKIVKARVEKAG